MISVRTQACPTWKCWRFQKLPLLSCFFFETWMFWTHGFVLLVLIWLQDYTVAFCHCSKVPICPWSWGAPAQPKTSGTNLCGTAGPSWQVMIHENPSCVPVFANFCRAKLVQVSILPIKSSKHGWHRSKHIVTSHDLYPILHPVPLVSPRRNEGRPRRAEPGPSVRPRSRSQWRKSRPVPRWLEKNGWGHAWKIFKVDLT